MIDCITIEYNQLHGARQLEYSLDFCLNLCVHHKRMNECQTKSARYSRTRTYVGRFGGESAMVEEHFLAWIVEHGAFGLRNVRTDPGDDDARLEAVFEEVEQCLLHHVGHLHPLE